MSLFISLLLIAQTGKDQRQPHPELPGLVVLTAKEKAYVAQVINDAILDDLGQLPKGKDAKEVRRALANLPPDAFPQLLEAFSYVANKGWSCPTNVLAAAAGLRNLTWNPTVRNLDMLMFVSKHLGDGVTSKVMPQTYKDVKITTERELKTAMVEIAAQLRKLQLSELIGRAEKSKGAERRLTIAAIASKRDDPAAGEFLLKSLKAVASDADKLVALEAIADWAGIERGASERESFGAIIEAATKRKAKLEGK